LQLGAGPHVGLLEVQLTHLGMLGAPWQHVMLAVLCCLALLPQVEFSDYRAAQRNTSEAQLQAALERATQAAGLAQERATKALKAKRQYKQQVTCHRACGAYCYVLCHASALVTFLHPKMYCVQPMLVL
jgi:hypothetical protein